MTKITPENLIKPIDIGNNNEKLNPIDIFVLSNQYIGHAENLFRQQLCDALNYHAEQVSVGFSEWKDENFWLTGDGKTYISNDDKKGYSLPQLFNKYLEELKQKQG